MSLIENRKARFDYEITDRYEAGIELVGHEVKSVKGGLGSLASSFVTVRGGEAFLIGMHIPPYQAGNTPKDYDPDRNRKLLLTKGEIETLAGVEKKKGLTIVPISVYNKGRKVKVELAIARGKKSFDKRLTTMKRETDRETRRTLKYE